MQKVTSITVSSKLPTTSLAPSKSIPQLNYYHSNKQTQLDPTRPVFSMDQELSISPVVPIATVVPATQPKCLAPGFRFHPTDEELVRYYLTRKACGKPFRFQAVSEIDVYKSEPWELAGPYHTHIY